MIPLTSAGRGADLVPWSGSRNEVKFRVRRSHRCEKCHLGAARSTSSILPSEGRWCPGSAMYLPRLPTHRNAFLTEARRLSPLISSSSSRPPAGRKRNGTLTMTSSKAGSCQHRLRELSFWFVHHWWWGRLSAGAHNTPTPTGQQAFNHSGFCWATDSQQAWLSGATNWGSTLIWLSAICGSADRYNWDCCGLSVEYRRFAWDRSATRISSASTSPWPI